MLLENLFYWNLIKAINDVAKCIIIKPIALNTSELNIREFLWGALVVVFGAKSDSSLLAPNFIGNQENRFFQSEQFGHLLKYVQENPQRCNLKQVKDKLSIGFEYVGKIEEGMKELGKMVL